MAVESQTLLNVFGGSTLKCGWQHCFRDKRDKRGKKDSTISNNILAGVFFFATFLFFIISLIFGLRAKIITDKKIYSNDYLVVRVIE